MPSLCSQHPSGSTLQVLVRRRSCRCPWRSLGSLRKGREEVTPIARLVEDCPHLITTVAVAIEPPMLELHTRAGVPLGNEADLYLSLQHRVILPVGSDVPGQDKSRMRLPREHAPPVAGTSVVSLLIPTATDASFDHRIHGIGLADLVDGQWPPGSHLFSEDLPHHFLRRFHDDDLLDAVR